jgi:hypothetical protein
LLTVSKSALRSFMSAGCWCRRWLAIDGGSGTCRGHAPEVRRPPLRAAPALLCRLTGDAKPGRDLGPGVPGLPEPSHGLGDRFVQLGGESGHVRQGVNIPGRYSPCVGAYHAADERGILVVLDRLSPPVWCQSGLDVGSPGAVDRAGWVVRRDGGICLLLPPRPRVGGTAWGLHPIGAGVVEPGVEVKLRLLDALDCQRLRASGLCSCGGGGPKDQAV